MEENRISHYNFSGDERRESNRFPFVFPVKYTYLGQDRDNPKSSEFSLYSFSNNISRGGMLLTLSNNVSAGECLDLVITLPIEHEVVTIQATGQVKWIRKESSGYLAGIAFIEMKDQDLAVIEKLLDAEGF